MDQYNIILESSKEAVATTAAASLNNNKYQSEQVLEEKLLADLEAIGYLRDESIKNNETLKSNLRKQLAALNKTEFTDNEWQQLFQKLKSMPMKEKTAIIQADSPAIQIHRDSGKDENIWLLKKGEDLCENKLQVIHQYETDMTEGAKHKTRYDVSILVNGLPLIHIELKRRGVNLQEAFNQIDRYWNDSFWAGDGLFEFVQLFVISNGTHTKYYSNTTKVDQQKKSHKRDNFEFTSYWAYQNNEKISDLEEFTQTFFKPISILSLLTKYCVRWHDSEGTDDRLLVMRPYQIAATEQIINKIRTSFSNTASGKKDGGYIWHTTGSGKTLTSFKTAELASQLTFNNTALLDKVVFVVDRKDLDYQTCKEFNKFSKGDEPAVDSTENTRALEKHFNDANSRIIVTTIQKLSKFIGNNTNHSVYNKKVVFIFDECHRSQFGEMHNKIVSKFKNYALFGFTGTPIFPENSDIKTTSDIFGDCLHKYTLPNAISDGNVLKFKVDYVETMQQKESIKEEKVEGITVNCAERVKLVTKYILDTFDCKTYNRAYNSIFAVSSIEAAKQYYQEFKEQQKGKENPIKVGIIYSYAPNEERKESDATSNLAEEQDDKISKLDKSSRDFLDDAMKDYNKMFGGSMYSTDGDSFHSYYIDISEKMKRKKLDLLIVVNMFLTGFDAPTLNTLWVDKDLRYHGLIQAFSRTNRIHNAQKAFGNIVCFRNLDSQTKDAIGLFANNDPTITSITLLKSYDEYYKDGYDEVDPKDKTKTKHIDGFIDMATDIKSTYPTGWLNKSVVTDDDKKDFAKKFGQILKRHNILRSFESFAVRDKSKDFTDREWQDYQSDYQVVYQQFKKIDESKKVDVTNDITFEISLLKSIDINLEYIFNIVREKLKKGEGKESIQHSISQQVSSSIGLKSKIALITCFINNISKPEDIDNWTTFIREQKNEEIKSIIDSYDLTDEAEHYINSHLDMEDYDIEESEVCALMKEQDDFFSDENKTATVIKRMTEFFEKYKDI